MKRFPALLVIAALLTGCAAPSSVRDSSGLTQGTSMKAVSLYDPDSALERSTQGAIRCYPLGQTGYSELFFLEGNLALLASEETSTTVLTLSPQTGAVVASSQFPFPISAEDPSFQYWDEGFSVYDALSGQTHVIDGNMQLLASLGMPSDSLGSPILSEDGHTLFYCTSTAIRALDISTGISRIVKETAHTGQTLSGLYGQDSVLHCTYSDEAGTHTLFLSAQNGSTLYQGQEVRRVITSDSCYYAHLQQGNQTIWVFGQGEETPYMLLMESESVILPKIHAAVEMGRQPSGQVVLNLISLDCGQKTASVPLNSSQIPSYFTVDDRGLIWFLGQDSNHDGITLYSWDPALSAIADSEIHVAPYISREEPDDDGIAQCEEYARNISSRYGIQILIHEQAVQVQPQGQQLVYEHLPAVILQELKQLEKYLSGYPEGFLQTIDARFDGLTICLVRSLSAGCNPQEPACGLQFWDGNHAYIALAPGSGSQRALYHGLCHLIDTIVLNECSAYDTWNQCNPSGFEYDYDFTANSHRNSTAYLLEHNRYFVDMFSMSFPKEDRARIMEYAMTAGNEGLFQTDAMQKKLTSMCRGIREAFHLEDWEAPLLWEQYLHTPIG